MITLYLIRHGETEWNLELKTQGCVNVDLTSKGVDQAIRIAEKLYISNNDFEKIYSSDLKRCYKTAEIIGSNLSLEITRVTELREMDFGLWEGLSISQIAEKYPKEYSGWRMSPEKAYIPNGENLKDVKKRCLKSLNDILINHTSGNIIIVSHTAAIKTIILGLLKIDLCHYYNITLNNGCISTIELRDYGPVLTSLNDINHLNSNMLKYTQGE